MSSSPLMKVQPTDRQVKSPPPPTQPKEKAGLIFHFATRGFLLKVFQLDQPKPIMSPATGERLLRFIGDKIHFSIRAGKNAAAQKKWSARLRTNLGRAAVRRQEIISAHAGRAVVANSSWRDVPMQKTSDGWEIELPLAEAGWFKAKAYLLDEKNWQHWPDGPDVGISVHPNFARTANTIYCAFPRLFGSTKSLPSARDEKLDAHIKALDEKDFAVIP